MSHSVENFRIFSVTPILREINLWDSRSVKSAILTQLEALNFDFYELLHFLKVEIYQINKIQSPPKMTKMAILQLLNSQKLVSSKI